jgi:hypothetical protein
VRGNPDHIISALVQPPATLGHRYGAFIPRIETANADNEQTKEFDTCVVTRTLDFHGRRRERSRDWM